MRVKDVADMEIGRRPGKAVPGLPMDHEDIPGAHVVGLVVDMMVGAAAVNNNDLQVIVRMELISFGQVLHIDAAGIRAVPRLSTKCLVREDVHVHG